MKPYLKRNKQGAIMYQDCYYLIDKRTKELIGVVKVKNQARIKSIILRANKILPFTKKLIYNEDYTLEFQGTFPIMVFPEDKEEDED